MLFHFFFSFFDRANIFCGIKIPQDNSSGINQIFFKKWEYPTKSQIQKIRSNCMYLWNNNIKMWLLIGIYLLQAAATACYVATHPKLAGVTGKYFSDCNEESSSKASERDKEASRLWTASESLVNKYCNEKPARLD